MTALADILPKELRCGTGPPPTLDPIVMQWKHKIAAVLWKHNPANPATLCFPGQQKSCGGNLWCARRGSNPQPLASEASTLSIELRAHLGDKAREGPVVILAR